MQIVFICHFPTVHVVYASNTAPGSKQSIEWNLWVYVASTLHTRYSSGFSPSHCKTWCWMIIVSHGPMQVQTNRQRLRSSASALLTSESSAHCLNFALLASSPLHALLWATTRVFGSRQAMLVTTFSAAWPRGCCECTLNAKSHVLRPDVNSEMQEVAL